MSKYHFVCAVDGCKNKSNCGLSFFKCPTEKHRCQAWKNALGFIGSHKYANITNQQCHYRIRICALHFDEDSFVNSSRNRIHIYSIPSLGLKINPIKTDDEDHTFIPNVRPNNVARKIEAHDAQVQTDYVESIDEYHAVHKDKGMQTTIKLPNGTLERTISTHKCKKMLETEVTMEDVVKFLEKNYSKESCKLLKTQLPLLNRAPKGSRPVGRKRNNTCFVPGCKTGYKKHNPNEEKISTFKAPRDVLERGKWANIIPRDDRVLQEHDCVCEKHFQPDDVIKFIEIYNEKIPYQRPKLRKGAVPSIFPDCSKYLSKMKVTSKRNHFRSWNEHQFNEIVETKEQPQSHSEEGTDLLDFNNLFTNKMVPNLEESWAILSCVEKTLTEHSKTILFSQNSVKNNIPVFNKQVIMSENFGLKYFFGNKPLKIDKLPDAVTTLQQMVDAINAFSKIPICFGATMDNSFDSLTNITKYAYIDSMSHTWRHNRCTLLNTENNFRCKFCNSLFKPFSRISTTSKKYINKNRRDILVKIAVDKYLLSNKLQRQRTIIQKLQKKYKKVKKELNEDYQNRLGDIIY